IRPEGDRGIAPGVEESRPGNAGIVREPGYPRNEPVRQRRSPRLAAVERGVHGATVIEVPVVGAGDQIARVERVGGDRRLVLGGRVTTHVHDDDGRPARAGGEGGTDCGGGGCLGASSEAEPERQQLGAHNNSGHCITPRAGRSREYAPARRARQRTSRFGTHHLRLVREPDAELFLYPGPTSSASASRSALVPPRFTSASA